LFDAAFFGSDIVVNYLLYRNANIHHKNKLGETIYEIIEEGRKNAFEEYPKAKRILADRFDECIRLVKQEEENEKLPKVESEKLESEKVESEKEFREEYDFDTLKEDLMKYIEKLDVCKRFINYLKKNKFTDLLVKVLDDEDMEDVLIDNPYLVKLI
jgi:DNA-directed RNA polymerase alpha subunit